MKRKPFIFLLLALIIFHAIYMRFSYVGSQFSPSGENELRIYKDNLYFGFPGSGSDAPGYARLLYKGTVVELYYVEILLDAEDIRWERIPFDSTGKPTDTPLGLQPFSVWKVLKFW